MSARQQQNPRGRDPLLAKIHIAKKQLGMDDDDYRAVIARVAPGRSSSKDLSPKQREALVDEFRKLGFRDRRAGSGRRFNPQHAKARALWWSLYWLGEIDNSDERALDAFAKRTAAVDAMRWANAGQSNKVIEGLKDWCERAGFDMPGDERTTALAKAREFAGLDPAGAGFAPKVRLIEVLWDKLIAAGQMRFGAHAAIDTWVRKKWGVSAPWFLTEAQAGKAVEELGRWYRKAIDKD